MVGTMVMANRATMVILVASLLAGCSSDATSDPEPVPTTLSGDSDDPSTPELESFGGSLFSNSAGAVTCSVSTSDESSEAFDDTVVDASVECVADQSFGTGRPLGCDLDYEGIYVMSGGDFTGQGCRGDTWYTPGIPELADGTVVSIGSVNCLVEDRGVLCHDAAAGTALMVSSFETSVIFIAPDATEEQLMDAAGWNDAPRPTAEITPATGADGAAYLQSPTGNLSCRLVPGATNGQVIDCFAREQTFVVPDYSAGVHGESCEARWGRDFVISDSSWPDTVCRSEAWTPAGDVLTLPYGTEARLGSLACHSTEQAMRCRRDITGEELVLSRSFVALRRGVPG